MLSDPLGWNADAPHVLGIWFRPNGLTPDNAVDVSYLPPRLRETLTRPNDGAADAGALESDQSDGGE